MLETSLDGNQGKDVIKDEHDGTTLSDMFDSAFESYNGIKKAEESTNSTKVQNEIRKAMSMLEDATRLVSMVNMFSDNENFEEVSTENIKYFLLPALLGMFTTKLSIDRAHVVNVAEIYFIDFLKRVKAYGLTDCHIPEAKAEEEKDHGSERTPSNAKLVTQMVVQRNTKLQRYQEQKDLKSRLETLSKNMSNLNIDDETKRTYFVTLIKLFVNEVTDELTLLATEKPILEHLKQMGRTEPMSSQSSQKHKHPSKKLQPIIITRDALQKKVYGAGYPSLPVLTVQEFYDQRVKEGDWPDPSQQMDSRCLQSAANADATDKAQQDIEDEEKEEKTERDDSEMLAQARAMDEYKDTHRRGWGNRANRS